MTWPKTALLPCGGHPQAGIPITNAALKSTPLFGLLLSHPSLALFCCYELADYTLRYQGLQPKPILITPDHQERCAPGITFKWLQEESVLFLHGSKRQLPSSLGAAKRCGFMARGTAQSSCGDASGPVLPASPSLEFSHVTSPLSLGARGSLQTAQPQCSMTRLKNQEPPVRRPRGAGPALVAPSKAPSKTSKPAKPVAGRA